METPTSEQLMPGAEKPTLLKLALAWAITMLFLYMLFYFISRAWKKGQEAGIAQ